MRNTNRKVKLKKTKHVFEKLEKSHLRRKSNKSLNYNLEEFSDNEETIDSSAERFNSTLKSQSSFHADTASIVQPILLNQSFGTEHFGKTHKPFCDTNSVNTARGSLNQSFTTAKSYISDRTSLADTANFTNSFFRHSSPKSINLEEDLDIDLSLNKLHLGNPLVRKSPNANAFSPNIHINRPKPVISPAKLRNVTQNSWVAGGFWRDCNGILMPINSFSNLSRSSSQTSGFISQIGQAEVNHFNSLPSSANNSFCGDLECNSVFSEPLYDLNGTNSVPARNFNPCCTKFSYQNNVRRCGNAYHPVAKHEQLVYIAPNCLQPYGGMYDICFNKNAINNAPNNTLTQDLQKKYF